MVETIAPVVHGDRRSRYRLAVALHTLGAALAAGALGLALGGLGALLGAPWGMAGLIAVAFVAGIYLLREAVGLPVPIPDRHRQVPEWWRSFYSPPVAALLYGLGLGVGFLTFLSFGTYVAVAAAALASGDPLIGALLCMPFGLARGLSGMVSSRTGSADAAASVTDRLEELAGGRLPRAVNALALAALFGTAALSALW